MCSPVYNIMMWMCEMYSKLQAFRTLSIVWYFGNYKAQSFGNCICFRFQVSRGRRQCCVPLLPGGGNRSGFRNVVLIVSKVPDDG
jgi:hypothetical protein